MPLPAHQLTLLPEKHRNHYLFSDYYLNTLLPRQPGWREADPEATRALEALRQLYADKRALLLGYLHVHAPHRLGGELVELDFCESIWYYVYTPLLRCVGSRVERLKS
jgi:hypothetical protein